MGALLARWRSDPVGARLRAVVPLSALIVLVSLNVTTSHSSFWVFVYNSVLLSMIGALALNLLLGTAGQVSVGNAAFLAVGAFGAAILARTGLPLPVTVAGAMVLGGLVGLVAGLPALRLSGLYLALATLAAHFIVIYAADRYQASAGGEIGLSARVLFRSQGLDGEQRHWTWLLTAVVVGVLVVVGKLAQGRTGRAWRLIRDNEMVAASTGVPVARLKLGVFVFTSMLIALQGALTAHMSGNVTSTRFTVILAISYVAMVVIGGLDSLVGSLMGALIVTSLPFVIPRLVGAGDSAFLTQNAPHLATIVYGVLVVVFVVAVPGGLQSVPRLVVGRWHRARRPQEVVARPRPSVPGS